MSTPPSGLVSALRAFKNAGPQPLDEASIARNVNLTFSFDGGGAPIGVGAHCYLAIDFPCRISGWKVVADVAGSISFDVDGAPFAAFPTLAPLVGTGGTPPHTIAAVSREADIGADPTALLAWRVTVPKGTVLHATVSNNDVISVCT